MGIFLRLFLCRNFTQEIEDNVLYQKNKIIKYRNPKLKIHICGLWEENEKIINSIFVKQNIQNENNEYKLDNYIWIPKIYDNNIINEEICKNIQENIENDKLQKEQSIDNHVILCFGDKNDMDIMLEEFCDIDRPRIIYVTEKEHNILKYRKYIKNIISKNMKIDEIKNNILLSLQEIDNYYNEKNKTDDKELPINIILTGMRLSGKSTFTNLILGKLMAFESNDIEYGTLNISEYNVYQDENIKENGIKIIDTPGMSENKEINEKALNGIKKYLNDKSKNKMYFILFFYNEGAFLGYSEELLKILNKCNYPVYFIINKSLDKSYKGKSHDIISKIKYLKKNGFSNLAKENNFIQVNIKSTTGKFYGMNTIFEKIGNSLEKKKFSNINILDMIKFYKEKKNWEDDELEIIK